MIELPKVITDFLADLTPEQASRVLTGRLNAAIYTPSAHGDGCLVGLALDGEGLCDYWRVENAFDSLCVRHRDRGGRNSYAAPRVVVEAIRTYLMGRMVAENAPRADTLLMAAGICTVAE